MSHTQHTEESSEIKLKEWRPNNTASLGDFSELGNRPWDDIRSIEIFPGVRLDARHFVVPNHWVRAGTAQLLSFRTIDPSVHGPDELNIEIARTREESIRRMLFALWLPRVTSKGVWEYAPESWLQMSRLLLRLIRWQVRERPSLSGLIWLDLKAHDLVAMQADVMKTVKGRERSAALLNNLADLGRRGLIIDYPQLSSEKSVGFLEGSNKGAEPGRADKAIPRNWRPFSDEFVAEFLWRGLWLQENLAKQLLDCWSELREINDEARRLGVNYRHPTLVAKRLACMSGRVWRDSTGATIEKLPFAFNLKTRWGSNHQNKWPPNDTRVINYLINILQTMNASVIAFCTGARLSELASATDRSLVGADKPRLVARTFKLVDDRKGAIRDWPLHPAAVRALELQMDLARRIRPDGTDHLWVLVIRSGLEPRGSPLHDLTRPMQSAVNQMNLAHLTDGEPAHLHRWRHTIARLVALSIVGSPHVIYDLFGHKDLDMTLKYMLSSPDIMKDVIRVSREAVAAVCKEAVEDTAAGIASGPAARSLEDGLDKLRMSRGEEIYEATSLRDLAEILTDNGQRWEIVQPGVLCTKAPGQFGPCTQGRGLPDPGSCRTTCDHRLETSRARAQCDAVINALVLETKAAIESGLEMVAENLKGQLLANLHRWDDLRDAWIARDAVAASVWEERRRG